MQHSSHTKHQGFTLVELSIVLVVIGLLTGGILAGQEMIHASELNRVIKDFKSFETSTNAFREKYLMLPGDLKNATDYWGALNSDAATCATIPGENGTATCNGNGDDVISELNYEDYRFWQHLGNAQLLNGNYRGVLSPTTGIAEAEYNVPAGPYGGGYYTVGVYYNNNLLNFYNGTLNEGFKGRYFAFVKAGTVNGDPANSAGVASHEDAFQIDAKMDDGIANSGKVRASLMYNSVSVPGGTCATYTPTNKTDFCVVAYIF